MNTQTVLEVVGLLLGGGGGVQLITKVTRLVVAIEQLVDSHKMLTEKVAEHENRLTRNGLLQPVRRAPDVGG